MPLPEIGYGVSADRLAKESPAYLKLVVEAGRKDPVENMKFRIAIRELCREDANFRAMILELCRREPLFFCNVFCYVQEPRGKGGTKTLPFITYGYQDRFLLDLFECLGVRHHQTLKSRTMGWTWMVSGVAASHEFCFNSAYALMSSRKKEMVDDTKNPDTIMAKLDFVLDRLPWWMKEGYDSSDSQCKQDMHRHNRETDAIYTGAATVGDLGRGGRRTWAMRDEFAAWTVTDSKAADSALQHVTQCIVDGSTPQGDVGAFRDNWFNDASPALKVELCWEDHPVYRRGMYRGTEGNLELLDDDYWDQEGAVHQRWNKGKLLHFTKDTYPFVMDGKLRSPWYDDQCLICGSAVRIAQELDRSFTGSDSPFFDHMIVQDIEKVARRDPLKVVNLKVDGDSGRLISWEESDAGLMKLWVTPDSGDRMPNGVYVIGADVATGSGGDYSSQSVLSVFNKITGEQVAEFASRGIRPTRFAEFAHAVCKWFHDATIIWEGGAPGTAFGGRLWQELRYPHCYYPIKNERNGQTKLATAPGWWPRPESKFKAFEDFASDQAQKTIVLRSEKCYQEQRQFVWDGVNDVCHRASRSAESPSERKGNHGDLVSAAVLANKVMRESSEAVEKTERQLPSNSLAWRMEKRKRKKIELEGVLTPSGVAY